MISYIDKDCEFTNIISSFDVHDVFLTKILISYKSYSLDYKYTDYWCQRVNDIYTSLIFRVDGQFILYLSDSSELKEIEEFLNFLGFDSVLYNEKYKLNIFGNQQHTGFIMELVNIENLFNHKDINSSFGDFRFEICREENFKRIYSFFNSINSCDVRINNYGAFATDLNTKIRSGCGYAFSIYKYEKLHSSIVSCCITLTDGYNGIIGPVATLDEYRKKDFAKALISYVNAKNYFKNLVLLCNDDVRKEIYSKMGFQPIGRWKEIHR